MVDTLTTIEVVTVWLAGFAAGIGAMLLVSLLWSPLDRFIDWLTKW